MPMNLHLILHSITFTVWSMSLIVVQANWDQATGFLQGYTISNNWTKAHPAKICSKNIQLAECSHNTRTKHPNIQFMAVFTVDHSKDTYYGCPYGECCAFSEFPSLSDLVPKSTDSHIFVWHGLGGNPGLGTNPIANPKTGVFGWEEGIRGKYVDGPPDFKTYQPQHDAKYPNFKCPSNWPIGKPEKQIDQHPICGKKGEKKNKDPNPNGNIKGKGKPDLTKKEKKKNK
ncbi:hypothetical protein CROQUDRAFT_723232 [Cronartium quercuum f. sp. fusiforme G11]|uniref:Secreted protein n=1 Tax=Cronartium quercuum f. sp. fusiforme G11 TaxID=708437 RepID=A0A9P6NH26_9BASI|nr:hypothetical protein CROQUDRAFT_723232 [Cronartium quercuum f. sp. fusiforme G11]